MATVTITSKNQITIPAELLREKPLKKGQKLQALWEGDKLVLSPQEDLATILNEVQAHLRPLIRKPMTDEDLQENLRNWPKEMQ